MTTYCRLCPASFSAFMHPDLNEERLMLLDHYTSKHGIKDPVISSFTIDEVEAVCRKMGRHVHGRPM